MLQCNPFADLRAEMDLSQDARFSMAITEAARYVTVTLALSSACYEKEAAEGAFLNLTLWSPA